MTILDTPQWRDMQSGGTLDFLAHIDGVDIWCDYTGVPYCLVFKDAAAGVRWQWLSAEGAMRSWAPWMSEALVNFLTAHSLLTT